MVDNTNCEKVNHGQKLFPHAKFHDKNSRFLHSSRLVLFFFLLSIPHHHASHHDTSLGKDRTGISGDNTIYAASLTLSCYAIVVSVTLWDAAGYGIYCQCRSITGIVVSSLS
jgi:hypothetical protein